MDSNDLREITRTWERQRFSVLERSPALYQDIRSAIEEGSRPGTILNLIDAALDEVPTPATIVSAATSAFDQIRTLLSQRGTRGLPRAPDRVNARTRDARRAEDEPPGPRRAAITRPPCSRGRTSTTSARWLPGGCDRVNPASGRPGRPKKQIDPSRPTALADIMPAAHCDLAARRVARSHLPNDYPTDTPLSRIPRS